MTKASKTADFLQNVTDDLEAIQPPGPREKAEAQRRKPSPPTRVGLKHLGGYLKCTNETLPICKMHK